MARNNNELELLAPAQNLETAICAIKCGADAVYIGAKSFGARKSASNNLENIKALIEYAHKFNVKIYITINTILNDNELKEAQKLIYELYEIGADAIIIQDMGLLELDLPPIELHASTQCNIRTKEKVQFFEQVGIKRAILARELSVSQIEEISENSNIELECFIHGALCVSYSGQCYLSASVGGRSANRGECAQACRKKYSLVQNEKTIAKDKYLLSLKDFCAEKYLDALIKAGVKSFKIEGRLKNETYVKNVVLYYRRFLDKYKKTSKGDIISDFEPDINKTFNRGYTSYFLGGNREAEENKIFNFETPKATGEYVGEVKEVGRNYFKIKTSKKINKQDGLFFVLKDKTGGCLVNNIEDGKIFPNKPLDIKAGAKVYRNQDTEFENTVKNTKTKRLIKTEITVYEDKISITDGEFETSVVCEFEEEAKNPEKMRESFVKCFKKTGEGIFCAKDVIFKTQKTPFVVLSKLNEIRRELFSKLENIRLINYKRNNFEKTKYAPYPEKITDYRLNVHNKAAEDFYKKCGVCPTDVSPEKSGNYKGKELMRTKHCLRRTNGLCLKKDGLKAPLFLADEFGKKYLLEFDCVNCEMVIKEA